VDTANVIVPGLPARQALASLIKQARRAVQVGGKPMTQQRLATLTGCSQGKIQKIEAAAHRIEPHDVEKFIEVLAVAPAVADEMRQLVAFNAVGEPWSGERALVPEYVRPYLDAELVAAEILSWHGRIPGPLQSFHFALGLAGEGRINIAPFVRNRERRKAVFHQPQLKRYACVLAEETLRRAARAIGREVLRDQIDHLLAITDPDHPKPLADDRTTVYLLPLDAPVLYLPNDFSLLHFDGPAPAMVYVEYVGGGRCLRSTEVVEAAERTWQSIRDAALDRDNTITFLHKLRDEFATR
jgi:hypothetical protein